MTDTTTDWTPTPTDSPYDRLGGSPGVRALVERFYDIMAREEPALARLHPVDPEGRILPANQDRFAMFLIGWLGGPQDFVQQHGHPRLRMRHAKVPVDTTMRDAWMRTMKRAMDERQITGAVRTFLETRLGDVADFLRNSPG